MDKLQQREASVLESLILNVSMSSMSTVSVVSKKIVRDPMSSYSMKPYNFQISRQLIISCNAAYSKYKDSLIVSGKAKTKQEMGKEKSTVISEISKVSQKRNKLLDVSKLLDKEFMATLRKAKKDGKNCFTMLAKSNALKRKSEGLLVDLKKLDEIVEPLEAKKQKLDK